MILVVLVLQLTVATPDPQEKLQYFRLDSCSDPLSTLIMKTEENREGTY
jgi:hypothetical protein